MGRLQCRLQILHMGAFMYDGKLSLRMILHLPAWLWRAHANETEMLPHHMHRGSERHLAALMMRQACRMLTKHVDMNGFGLLNSVH